jgi:hypothetical protein
VKFQRNSIREPIVLLAAPIDSEKKNLKDVKTNSKLCFVANYAGSTLQKYVWLNKTLGTVMI